MKAEAARGVSAPYKYTRRRASGGARALTEVGEERHRGGQGSDEHGVDGVSVNVGEAVSSGVVRVALGRDPRVPVHKHVVRSDAQYYEHGQPAEEREVLVPIAVSRGPQEAVDEVGAEEGAEDLAHADDHHEERTETEPHVEADEHDRDGDLGNVLCD